MTVSDLEIFRAAHLHLNRPGAPFGAAASQKPATPWGVHLCILGWHDADRWCIAAAAAHALMMSAYPLL
jgi:hypothetical protein